MDINIKAENQKKAKQNWNWTSQNKKDWMKLYKPQRVQRVDTPEKK